MPPKKGETACKDKEDFALLQIFGKFFYLPPGSPPGFLSESGCKSTAFFRTRKLITHFFYRFFEFIFKRIVIQPFTDEWFFMKGLRCTEPYTLLYYIRNKQSDFNRQKCIRLYPTIKPYASTNAACFISLPSRLCSKRHINTNYSLLINRSRSTM